MASRLAWRWRKAPRLPLPGGGSLELQPDPWGDVDLARLPAQLQVAGRAALGEATFAKVALHCPLSPLSLAASIQLDACIPNFLVQEHNEVNDILSGT